MYAKLFEFETLGRPSGPTLYPAPYVKATFFPPGKLYDCPPLNPAFPWIPPGPAWNP